MHGLAIEALGGVKLERAVDAQHVDGAHLRHHVGGDQHDDLVEAFLRAYRFRHHLAEATQQHARTAKHTTHEGPLAWAGLFRASMTRPGRSGNSLKDLTGLARPPAGTDRNGPACEGSGPGGLPVEAV